MHRLSPAPRTARALWPFAAALVLLAASCGSSGSTNDAADSDDTSSEAADGSEVSTSGEAEDTEESEAAAPADDAMEDDEVGSDVVESEDVESEEVENGEVAGGSDGSCLVGNWVMTEDTMNGFYDALESSMDGAPVDFQISGSTKVDFNADGTFQYVPNFTLTMDTGGVGGEGITSGAARGTYTIDSEAGTILADFTEDDLDIVITVSGITISAAETGVDLAVAPINEAPFDCSGGNPVLMFEVGDGARVPVELTPA